MPKPLTQISFDFSLEDAGDNEAKLPMVNEAPAPAQADKAPTDTLTPETPATGQHPTQPQQLTKSKGRRSLKLRTDAPIVLPPDEILFQKTYYPIGEVASMFGVNQSLLRYWETEFDIIKPRKNGKGDRYFRPKDVKNLQLIHDLLRRRKYTIEGAKAFLKNNTKRDEHFDMIRSLENMKAFLLELKASL